MQLKRIPRIDPITSGGTQTVPQTVPSSGQNLYINYQYDEKNGIVTWILGNGTSQTQYLGIMRGAVIDGYYIKPYYFGSAFWPVYLGTINGENVSTLITNLNNIRPYSLAAINNKFIGFVFSVPPYSEMHVPEAGFNGLRSLFYQLVVLTPDQLNSYIVFWNPALQWVLYNQQTGYTSIPVPDPYPASMYNFISNINVEPGVSVIMLKTHQTVVNVIRSIEQPILSLFTGLDTNT